MINLIAILFLFFVSGKAFAAVEESCVVYERVDLGVSIVFPSPGTGLSIGQIVSKDVPQGARRKVIPITMVPQRTRRDEWRFSNSREDGIELPTGSTRSAPSGQSGVK